MWILTTDHQTLPLPSSCNLIRTRTCSACRSSNCTRMKIAQETLYRTVTMWMNKCSWRVFQSFAMMMDSHDSSLSSYLASLAWISTTKTTSSATSTSRWTKRPILRTKWTLIVTPSEAPAPSPKTPPMWTSSSKDLSNSRARAALTLFHSDNPSYHAEDWATMCRFTLR